MDMKEHNIYSLESLLRWTRQEEGLSLHDLAQIMKEVFDDSELRVIAGEITRGN